jgi:hypothetical protein
LDRHLNGRPDDRNAIDLHDLGMVNLR